MSGDISKTNASGATEEVAVKTSGLTKKYRRGDVEFAALSNVDLTIRRGEFVAVSGASGSGKSTLLHLIAGLTRPTSGSVEVEGKRIFDGGDRATTIFRRRRIGVVFQNYNLIPCLTAEENVLFPLRADGRDVGATREKIRALCEELEISRQLSQYPDALSGGQRQRVALARALAPDPAVLLADEPTGNLDWESGQNVCRVLDKLNREEERTIVLVTHEPAVAIWASRLIVLRDGEIAADLPTNGFADASALAARCQEIARRRSANA
ncbi:MAG: ABC transporter ATP-binding protein [Thermoguttaceae bacterium]|nr:ABC transporter ATP-binding protein [Thermoguttaceae bacterium]